jgi:hypothetical protein
MALRRRILTRDEVLARLESAIEAHGGLRRFCRRHALGEANISNVRSARRSPPDAVLKLLGLEKQEVTYAHTYELVDDAEVVS